MGFEFYYTLALIVLLSVVLVREWLEAEVAVFAVLILLMVGRVIDARVAFQGFSNIGVLSIGLLFIIAGSLQTTGAIEQLSRLVLGKRPASYPKKLLRLLFPVSAASAFMNNTPLVALFIPTTRSWASKYGYPISKFLIPISYAAILGGMCTLIGTSTNLIVHGLLIENGQPGFTFFEITRIGLPAAIVGILFISFIGYRLLPHRGDPIVELGKRTREFVIELKVTRNYENVGRTIEEAGLRHLKGLFLFQIERNGKIIAPASPDERIQVNDRLFFTGLPKTILELQRTPGLQLIKDSSFDLKQYDSEKIKTYEAVISSSSPLVGKNVRESNFRSRYNAVIIAIHRSGERIQKKIGDIVLRPGDTLLLLADRDFLTRWYNSRDFYLVTNTVEIHSRPRWKAILSVLTVLTMVLLVSFKIMPLITAAGLAALVLILTRSISPSDAKEMIDWKVLVIIGSAIGIAHGINNSGLADVVAQGIIRVGSSWGALGVLVAIYLLTSLYNTIITSNATAALIFPIAFSASLKLGVDSHAFALAVAIAAAASFATPISYQTNLMVYGPGGYKFADYLKVGVPLQILVGIISLTALWWFYF